MNEDSRYLKEMIYDWMNGIYGENNTMIKGLYVENEFADGGFCDKVYNDIYNANIRLNDKLGNDNDHDIECIISGYRTLMKYFSMKMFDYGVLHTQNP